MKLAHQKSSISSESPKQSNISWSLVKWKAFAVLLQSSVLLGNHVDVTYPTLDGGFNVVADQCMKQCKAINVYISESAVKKIISIILAQCLSTVDNFTRGVCVLLSPPRITPQPTHTKPSDRSDRIHPLRAYCRGHSALNVVCEVTSNPGPVFLLWSPRRKASLILVRSHRNLPFAEWDLGFNVEIMDGISIWSPRMIQFTTHTSCSWGFVL